MATHEPPAPLPDAGVLRMIAEGVEAETGDRFFASLVRTVATGLGVLYALVSEVTADRTAFNSIAIWGRGTMQPNLLVPLAGTPCAGVLAGNILHKPCNLQQLYPDDVGLADWDAESYCGVPLVGVAGDVLGHLAVFDDNPMPDGERIIAVLRVFAARAGAELERLRAEHELRASEERYRGLYDEAPVAYLTFGPDAGIRKVNRRCCTMFRMTSEEIVGKTIFDLTADTALGRELLHRQFDEVLAGRDVFEDDELEGLRGDGSTFWIRVSSQVTRNEDGTIREVRTAAVDVTDRKLAEATARRLERHNVYLEEELRESHGFDDVVGQSPALRAVLQHVRLVADTDSTVLILGETGTGKELIARAVHGASRRRAKPFIKVNCAALPEGLIESELFGHERGAFTGATERRTGRFELAHGGTIFLDEVGEMPLEVQIKLLRVLQEHEIERVGGSKTIAVDVRVIAATNRDLTQAIAAGTFRQDLYYRLNVFPLTMPPLRDRRGDLALLVPYFVGRYARALGRKLTHIAPDTMARLEAYGWPGNVRELENVIERATILAPGPAFEVPVGVLPVATPNDPPAPAAPATEANDAEPASPPIGPRTLEDVERAHIQTVLRRTSWRIEGDQGAARILDVHPNTLRSRMKKLGIRRPASATDP